MSEEEITEAAIMSLEGDALSRFHWEHQQQPICRWEELKLLLLEYFRPLDEGTLQEQWMSVMQTGTVAAYQKEFIIKANPISKIEESISLGSYLKGLKDDVRREFRVHGLITLKETMIWSLRIDQKLHPEASQNLGQEYPYQKKSYFNTPPHNPNYNPRNSLTMAENTHTHPNQNFNNPHRRATFNPNCPNPNHNQNQPRLTLTNRKMLEHLAKGLCFTCNEKLSHKCVLKKGDECSGYFGGGGSQCEICGEY